MFSLVKHPLFHFILPQLVGILVEIVIRELRAHHRPEVAKNIGFRNIFVGGAAAVVAFRFIVFVKRCSDGFTFYDQ